MAWKRKILWTLLVALGSASLTLLGVDMEKFTVPPWILSAAWTGLVVVFYYEFKPAVVGWFTRNRTPTSSEVWEQDKGRGDLAALLIKSAPDFSKAEEIFNHCRYDKQPRALPVANKAMVNRLIKRNFTRLQARLSFLSR